MLEFGKKSVPFTSEELEATWTLRPIRNETEYDRVRELTEKVVVLTDPTPLQEEWCDRLCDFMEAYEDVHHPM